MTARTGAPMPASLRATLRSQRHPSSEVRCPHCQAPVGQPCTVRSRNAVLRVPHFQRLSAWAQEQAACPSCGAAAGGPCREGDGRARFTVHAARYEADGAGS